MKTKWMCLTCIMVMVAVCGALPSYGDWVTPPVSPEADYLKNATIEVENINLQPNTSYNLKLLLNSTEIGYEKNEDTDANGKFEWTCVPVGSWTVSNDWKARLAGGGGTHYVDYNVIEPGGGTTEED